MSGIKLEVHFIIHKKAIVAIYMLSFITMSLETEGYRRYILHHQNTRFTSVRLECHASSKLDGRCVHQCHACGEYRQPSNRQKIASTITKQAHTLRPGLRVNEPLNFIIIPDTLSPIDAWRLWWWTGAAVAP